MAPLKTLGMRVPAANLSIGRPGPVQIPGKPWQKGPTAAKRVTGRALQARNARIKLRDRHTCAACGRVSLDHDVDHRIPLTQGGSEADDNLQLLCSGKDQKGNDRCHNRKSQTERG